METVEFSGVRTMPYCFLGTKQTYSLADAGHSFQIKDVNGDEFDELDEGRLTGSFSVVWPLTT